MFKFILGGIIGAVVVAMSYSEELAEAKQKNETLRKECEKHRRQDSAQKPTFYQNGNLNRKAKNCNLSKQSRTSKKSTFDEKIERFIKL